MWMSPPRRFAHSDARKLHRGDAAPDTIEEVNTPPELIAA